MEFKQDICNIILNFIPELDINVVYNWIEIPPQSDMGDYAIPCFHLARQLKKSPVQIAQNLAQQLILTDYFSEVKAVGPYINFYVNKQIFAEKVLNNIIKYGNMYGYSNEYVNKKLVIEYSSPNIAKPFHIGHFVNTILGVSIDRMQRTLGYQTFKINHLGDYGVQFGKLIVAYKLWWHETQKQDEFEKLLEIYVKFHKESECNLNLEIEAKQWFKKLEDGDEEANNYWQYFRDISIKKFSRIYTELGAEFDSWNGEAFYKDKLANIIKILEEKNLLILSDGAKVIDLDAYKMPPCIIVKSDGASIYATRDLAAALYRAQNYKFDKLLYIVGSEQCLYFKQIFKVLNLAKYEWSDKLEHISYGFVKLPEGKMSTRKGSVVLYEELLEETSLKVKEIIAEKNPNLTKNSDIIKKIALGALIATFLKTNREKDIVFRWEDTLSFDGDSGPYLQYTNVRCLSILKKMGLNINNDLTNIVSYFNNIQPNLNILTTNEEFLLIKELKNFTNNVKLAATLFEPCIIFRNLIEIAKAFNRFYKECPIYLATDDLKYARIILVASTSQVFINGFYLLGMPYPTEM